MSIKFRCGNCKQKLEAEDSDAGAITECPKCETEIEIPEPPPPIARAVSNLTLMFRPSQFQEPMEAKPVQPPTVAKAKPLEPAPETAPPEEAVAEEEVVAEPAIEQPPPPATKNTEDTAPEKEVAEEPAIEQPPVQATNNKKDAASRKEILKKRSLGLGPAASSRARTSDGNPPAKGNLRKFNLKINSKSTAGAQKQAPAPNISRPGLKKTGAPSLKKPVSASKLGAAAAPAIQQPSLNKPGTKSASLSAPKLGATSAPSIQPPTAAKPEEVQVKPPETAQMEKRVQEVFKPIKTAPAPAAPQPETVSAASEAVQAPTPQITPAGTSIAVKSEVTQVMKRPEPKEPPLPTPRSVPSQTQPQPAAAKTSAPATGKTPPPLPQKKTFGNCPKCNAGLLVKDAAICVECGHNLKLGLNVKSTAKIKKIGKVWVVLVIAGLAALAAGGLWAGVAALTQREFGWIAVFVGAITGGTICLLTSERSVRMGLAALGLAFCGWFSGKLITSQVLFGSDEKMAKVLKKEDISDIETSKSLVMEMVLDNKISEELSQAYEDEINRISPPERLKEELNKLKKEVDGKVKNMKPLERAELEVRLMRKTGGDFLVTLISFIAVFSLWDLLWVFLALSTAYQLGAGTNKLQRR